jgi:nucleotide-binding universal stress UspA family protein
MAHSLLRKTLVIHDGSKHANKAFEKALALTLFAESELHVMYVSESPPQFASMVGEVEEHKEAEEAFYDDLAGKLRRQAAGKEMSLETHFHYGQNIETIVSFIKDHYFDLLVIGSLGRSNIFKKLMGLRVNTAKNLALSAPCTVLMVK